MVMVFYGEGVLLFVGYFLLFSYFFGGDVYVVGDGMVFVVGEDGWVYCYFVVYYWYYVYIFGVGSDY